MYKFRVKEATNLLDAVQEGIPGISRQKARQIIEKNDITRNGKTVKSFLKLDVSKGDEMVFTEKSVATVHQEKKGPRKNSEIKLYFEDSHLLVAYKPAGILSSGESTLKSPTFHKVLESFLTEREGKKVRLWIVHRLDREVEGLIIFAKSDEVMNLFKDNWKTVEKRYLALTEQKPNPAEGVISSWLKDGYKQKVVSLNKEIEGARWSETKYTFKESFGKYHLIEVALVTGRKNQIRVHLSDIGCPIVGDWKYGADKSIVRQIRLISSHITFKHPVTGQLKTFNHQPNNRFFKPSETEDERYK